MTRLPIVRFLSVAVLFLVPGAARPDDAAAQAAREIERLRSTSWADRQAAEEALVALGEGAIEPLLPFVDDADPEVGERVGRILRANGGWRRVPGLVVAELDRLTAELAQTLAQNEWQAQWFLCTLLSRPIRTPLETAYAPSPAGTRAAVPIWDDIHRIAAGGGPIVARSLADRARERRDTIGWALTTALGETGCDESIPLLASVAEAWGDADGAGYVSIGLSRSPLDAAFEMLRARYDATAPTAPSRLGNMFQAPETARGLLARCLRVSPAPAAEAWFRERLEDPDPNLRVGAAARILARGQTLHGYNPLLPPADQQERLATLRRDLDTPPEDPWSRPSFYLRTSPIQMILRTIQDPAIWGENEPVRVQLEALAQAAMGMGLPMLAGSIGGEDPTWVMTDLPAAVGALGALEVAAAVHPLARTGMDPDPCDGDPWPLFHAILHIGSSDATIVQRLMSDEVLGAGTAERRRHGEKDYLEVPLPQEEGSPRRAIYAAATPSGLAVALQESDMRAWLDVGAASVADFLQAKAPDVVRAPDPGPLGISGWIDVGRIPGLGILSAELGLGGNGTPDQFAIDALLGTSREGPATFRAGLDGGFLEARLDIPMAADHPLYHRLRVPPRALDLRSGVGRDDLFVLAAAIPPPAAFWREQMDRFSALRSVAYDNAEIERDFLACETEIDRECREEVGMSFRECLAPFGEEFAFGVSTVEPLGLWVATRMADLPAAERVLRSIARAQTGAELPSRMHQGHTILPLDGHGVAAAFGEGRALLGGYVSFCGSPPETTAGVLDRWLDVAAGAAPRAAVFEPGDGFIPAGGVNVAMALNIVSAAREAEEIPEEILAATGLVDHPHVRAYALLDEDALRIRARLDVPVTRLVPGLGGVVARQIQEALGFGGPPR